MTTAPAGDTVDLIQLFGGVNRQLEQALAARLKPAGLSVEQYWILRALARRDGLAMGELAQKLVVDSPTLTKMIDRLVASADVYRGPDPHDRRKVLVFISDKGRARFETLGGDVEDVAAGLGDKLDPATVARLRGFLATILS